MTGNDRPRLHREFPSRLSEIDAVCTAIRSFLKTSNLASRCFDVELVARECLNNAVRHGNQEDSEKTVIFDLLIGPKWMRLHIADQGPGFDWRKPRNSETPETALSGRGLLILQLYTDRIAFNPPGNEITLWVKKVK